MFSEHQDVVVAAVEVVQGATIIYRACILCMILPSSVEEEKKKERKKERKKKAVADKNFSIENLNKGPHLETPNSLTRPK